MNLRMNEYNRFRLKQPCPFAQSTYHFAQIDLRREAKERVHTITNPNTQINRFPTVKQVLFNLITGR